MKTSVKNHIWNSMLDADLNDRYWHYLGRRYYNYDKYTKVFLAVMASGTVASWGIWREIEWLWKILSGMSAILAIALPILDWPKMTGRIVNVKQQWHQIKSEYENLWLECGKQDCDTKLLESELKKIRKKETSIVKSETNLPVKKRLTKKCHKEVLASHGLRET